MSLSYQSKMKDNIPPLNQDFKGTCYITPVHASKSEDY